MSEQQPNPNPVAEPSWSEALAVPLGFLGALLGAGLGGYLVSLASHRGFYAILIVGLAVGYGTILVARRGGAALTVLAAVVSLAASLFTEWKVWPFVADPGLYYFMGHIFDLGAFKLVCHAGAAAIAAMVVWNAPPRPSSKQSS